jgi:4-diphosphocytidyl-2-C-methyl-D-erythritol kinase
VSVRLLAPAKVNLCLFLGETRPDGLHRLCSLFEPLALADVLEIEAAERDEVICPGIEEGNLAAAALAALRERGWRGPPLRIEIEKRIPVAAGLGGGSADAAAVLRLARGEISGLGELAASLGADVPSQLAPALALVGGAGEEVERLPEPAPHAFVLLPAEEGLPTADVYAEADRLGLGRPAEELEGIRVQLEAAAGAGESPLRYADMLRNDLEAAALSLRPEIADALQALRAAGAAPAMVTGSGPTAAGLFDGIDAARDAAEQIGRPGAIVCAAGVPPAFEMHPRLDHEGAR